MCDTKELQRQSPGIMGRLQALYKRFAIFIHSCFLIILLLRGLVKIKPSLINGPTFHCGWCDLYTVTYKRCPPDVTHFECVNNLCGDCKAKTLPPVRWEDMIKRYNKYAIISL
ncbi:hypothetical protein C8A00DRAFT_35862 [Chaetomidium leptoderma]|uniref:Uncharacterized protein n=1 Tax=Chaetomidium leptoderma TaxID=669021 RepID=A0AAN6VJT6_9PEZI|nr:hypothetical protein C8A00DRAFT_35862 [Chaetomidium leptoderma]